MGCSCTKGGDSGRGQSGAGKRPEDRYRCEGGGGTSEELLADGSRSSPARKKGLLGKIGRIILPVGGKKDKEPVQDSGKDGAGTLGGDTTAADPAAVHLNTAAAAMDASKVAEHPYSLSRFSQKTVGLLSGFDDAAADHEPSSKESMSLREIKLYVSTPTDTTTSSLIDMRHNAFLSASASTSSSSSHDKTMSVFAHLRVHAAKPANNFDLNVIDLNQSARLEPPTSSSLLSNKYFKRKLNQIVLSDTLNLPKLRSSLNNYSASQYLFVVYLSDALLAENESASLLCPDSIDHDDYKRHVEKTLGRDELALFNRLYKKQPKSGTDEEDKLKYKLVVDFFNTDSANSLASLTDDLASMLAVFRSRFADEDDEEGGRAFKLKYLKSIQQEEIELAIRHVHDSSIVWFHVTSALTAAFTQAESAGASSQPLTFNQVRYKAVLNSLQSKVLAHNYKHISLLADSGGSQVAASENEKTMNEFIFSSVKAQLDAFMSEHGGAAAQSKTLALKIDKQLAEEIHAHYELYKNLSRCESRLSQENRHKQQSFESKLSAYLAAKETRHPLVLYSAAAGEHLKDYSFCC